MTRTKHIFYVFPAYHSYTHRTPFLSATEKLQDMNTKIKVHRIIPPGEHGFKKLIYSRCKCKVQLY